MSKVDMENLSVRDDTLEDIQHIKNSTLFKTPMQDRQNPEDILEQANSPLDRSISASK